MASSDVSAVAGDLDVLDAEADEDEQRIAEPADLAAGDERRRAMLAKRKPDRGDLADGPRRVALDLLGDAAQAARQEVGERAAATRPSAWSSAATSAAAPCLAFPHRRHDASSTIQATSSGKLCPAWAASSGTSDVRVMPGCVFTSSQITSPDPSSS